MKRNRIKIEVFLGRTISLDLDTKRFVVESVPNRDISSTSFFELKRRLRKYIADLGDVTKLKGKRVVFRIGWPERWVSGSIVGIDKGRPYEFGKPLSLTIQYRERGAVKTRVVSEHDLYEPKGVDIKALNRLAASVRRIEKTSEAVKSKLRRFGKQVFPFA